MLVDYSFLPLGGRELELFAARLFLARAGDYYGFLLPAVSHDLWFGCELETWSGFFVGALKRGLGCGVVSLD